MSATAGTMPWADELPTMQAQVAMPPAHDQMAAAMHSMPAQYLMSEPVAMPAAPTTQVVPIDLGDRERLWLRHRLRTTAIIATAATLIVACIAVAATVLVPKLVTTEPVAAEQAQRAGGASGAMSLDQYLGGGGTSGAAPGGSGFGSGANGPSGSNVPGGATGPNGSMPGMPGIGGRAAGSNSRVPQGAMPSMPSMPQSGGGSGTMPSRSGFPQGQAGGMPRGQAGAMPQSGQAGAMPQGQMGAMPQSGQAGAMPQGQAGAMPQGQMGAMPQGGTRPQAGAATGGVAGVVQPASATFVLMPSAQGGWTVVTASAQSIVDALGASADVSRSGSLGFVWRNDGWQPVYVVSGGVVTSQPLIGAAQGQAGLPNVGAGAGTPGAGQPGAGQPGAGQPGAGTGMQPGGMPQPGGAAQPAAAAGGGPPAKGQ